MAKIPLKLYFNNLKTIDDETDPQYLKDVKRKFAVVIYSDARNLFDCLHSKNAEKECRKVSNAIN